MELFDRLTFERKNYDRFKSVNITYFMIFVVLFLVIYNTLENSRYISKGVSLLSFCLAALGVFGIQRMFSRSGMFHGFGHNLDRNLMPYIVMGIIVLIIVAAIKIMKR